MRQIPSPLTRSVRDRSVGKRTHTTLNPQELLAAKQGLNKHTAENQGRNQEYERLKKAYAELHRKSLGLTKGKQDKQLRQTQLQRVNDKLVLQIKHSEGKLTEVLRSPPPPLHLTPV